MRVEWMCPTQSSWRLVADSSAAEWRVVTAPHFRPGHCSLNSPLVKIIRTISRSPLCQTSHVRLSVCCALVPAPGTFSPSVPPPVRLATAQAFPVLLSDQLPRWRSLRHMQSPHGTHLWYDLWYCLVKKSSHPARRERSEELQNLNNFPVVSRYVQSYNVDAVFLLRLAGNKFAVRVSGATNNRRKEGAKNAVLLASLWWFYVVYKRNLF